MKKYYISRKWPLSKDKIKVGQLLIDKKKGHTDDDSDLYITEKEFMKKHSKKQKGGTSEGRT
jgi:hypothetical protein